MNIRINRATPGNETEDGGQKRPSRLGYAFSFLLGAAVMALLVVSMNRPAGSVPFAKINAKINAVPAGNDSSPIPHSKTVAGEFEYTDIPLEEPLENLPDTSQPLAAPRWEFANYSPDDLVKLISGCDLRDDQKAALLDPKRSVYSREGIILSPPPEVVFDLSPTARARLYAVLSDAGKNSAQRDPFQFRPDKFDEWCASTGLGEQQLSLLRKLTYMQGGLLCFSDGAIVQRLFEPAEFNSLVRALYRKRTFLMRLVVDANSDVEAITRYWKKGGRVQALRPLFESMAKVPGGTSINVSYLLPIFPRTHMYTYSIPTHDRTQHDENCFWTAMNFFRDQPDPQFSSVENTKRVLASDYSQRSDPPIYGDLIMLNDSSGRPIHLCVYLADDVVFTKNGGDSMHPWVLMKIADMRAYYNARQPSQMTVYRSRSDSAHECNRPWMGQR